MSDVLAQMLADVDSLLGLEVSGFRAPEVAHEDRVRALRRTASRGAEIADYLARLQAAHEERDAALTRIAELEREIGEINALGTRALVAIGHPLAKQWGAAFALGALGSHLADASAAVDRLNREAARLETERRGLVERVRVLEESAARNDREIHNLLNIVCSHPACTAAIVRRDDGSRVCAAGHSARWVNVDLLTSAESALTTERAAHAETRRVLEAERAVIAAIKSGLTPSHAETISEQSMLNRIAGIEARVSDERLVAEARRRIAERGGK